MKFPQRIIEERKKQGISQAQIAEALDTTQQMYNRYEQSQVELPAYRLIAIAELLDVSLDWITGRTDKKEVQK